MNYPPACIIISILFFCSAEQIFSQENIIQIPDPLIAEAYGKASNQNILAAVNPNVFFGYFSVCADGLGFGFGNTYPSLDGHQMSDALLWLGQINVVKANWEYVKKFQKENGALPIAIIPGEAGKLIGPSGFQAQVDLNGGLYKHWVPGDPLRALAGVTYIQNADVIFRFSQDKEWLKKNLPSVNLSADHLASMITKNGAVGGAGYYVERPVRIEFDGVSQCHAINAFDRLAGLNALVGNKTAEIKYRNLAKRIKKNFQTNFWLKNQFAEYIHPDRGTIATHGLTDVDWSALAMKAATDKQISTLWPKLQLEKKFYYKGMPTGIAVFPEKYEKWESTFGDNQDRAAMGRVWYIEAWARYNMKDPIGLIETIHRVCEAGREDGYYWRERYNENGGYGAEKYNEYPANLIRIVQRFLLGVDIELDGAISIKPMVPDLFWEKGFGQTLSWNNSTLTYTMFENSIKGILSGHYPNKLVIRFKTFPKEKKIQALVNGRQVGVDVNNDCIHIVFPESENDQVVRFEISQQ